MTNFSEKISGSRFGIFGGTFNPIHNTHLDVAREVLEKTDLDGILFVPAAASPWRAQETDMAEASDRIAMVRLAIQGEKRFFVSDMEARRKGLSYTFDTVSLLRKKNPEKDFFLVLGMDAMLGIHLWHRGDELLALIPFLVLTRPGSKDADLQSVLQGYEKRGDGFFCSDRPAIRMIRVTPSLLSATEIRKRICQNMNVSDMLPEAVRGYIEKRGLYACTSRS